MKYNIHFSIISAIYLLITTVFYQRQARIKSARSALFRALLVTGILTLLLDILAAAIDPYAYRWPSWAVHAVNILFLSSVQVSSLLFYYYAIHLAGAYAHARTRAYMLAAAPFCIAIALILLSPFTSFGVYYLDAAHVYHHGATHLVLYSTTAMYLLGSLAVVFARRRTLQKLKFYTVLAFLLATLTAMVVQMHFPYLLLNATANAFALTLIYYILEAPGAHVDALTGVLNHAALAPMLRDMYEERARLTLILFTFNSLYIVNHALGMAGGDHALTEFAKYLEKAFAKRAVFRIEGDAFAVLLRGDRYIDRDALAGLYARTMESFALDQDTQTLDISVAGVNSEDCVNAREMMAAVEHLREMHNARSLDRVFLADAPFIARMRMTEAVEKATLRALDENRVEVYYQPIHRPDGRLCALEALVRVTDPEIGPLPTQTMVELAEKNGAILRLGEQVLRNTCAFLRDHHADTWNLDHVGVNLSAVQCVRKDLPEMVGGILAEYGMPAGLIAFEVTETAVSALSAVRENMDRLSEHGLYFLLDDFGTGYANFRNLTALPYRLIKLDKSLLWTATESENRMRLLRGIVRVVHALGLGCLCEGVETREQVALLSSMGVGMLQGYYYSKPLSPEALLAYVERAGARV